MIDAALREVQTELAGLRTRYREASEAAALLIGDDYIESGTKGKPKEEDLLGKLEAFLNRAAVRKGFLERQAVALHEAAMELRSAYENSNDG